MNAGVRKYAPAMAAAREGEGVSRRGLLEAAGAAARGLQLRPTLRLVLEKMASCYGEQDLAAGLMVWPSNAWLVEATGMAERTVRQAIGELVALRIVAPVDSANRKRFARRDRSGKIVAAFGFNLGPLYARRNEFQSLAVERRERERVRQAKFDELTILRKAMESMLDELTGHSDARTLTETLEKLVQTFPRRSGGIDPERALGDATALHARIMAILQGIKEKNAASAGAGRRHIEDNTNASIEACQDSEICDAGLLNEACPALREDFGMTVTNVESLKRIGAQLRGAIQCSLDGWLEVVGLVGDVRAAALVLYVLQAHADDRRGMIKSPGGLYRDLGRRLAAGQMNLVAELQALRRRKSQGAKRA